MYKVLEVGVRATELLDSTVLFVTFDAVVLPIFFFFAVLFAGGCYVSFSTGWVLNSLSLIELFCRCASLVDRLVTLLVTLVSTGRVPDLRPPSSSIGVTFASGVVAVAIVSFVFVVFPLIRICSTNCSLFPPSIDLSCCIDLTKLLILVISAGTNAVKLLLFVRASFVELSLSSRVLLHLVFSRLVVCKSQ